VKPIRLGYNFDVLEREGDPQWQKKSIVFH
jgi:hypothetical protein